MNPEVDSGEDKAVSARMERMIALMAVEMGRFPTEDEVYDFIMGDEETRENILKKAKDGN